MIEWNDYYNISWYFNMAHEELRIDSQLHDIFYTITLPAPTVFPHFVACTSFYAIIFFLYFYSCNANRSHIFIRNKNSWNLNQIAAHGQTYNHTIIHNYFAFFFRFWNFENDHSIYIYHGTIVRKECQYIIINVTINRIAHHFDWSKMKFCYNNEGMKQVVRSIRKSDFERIFLLLKFLYKSWLTTNIFGPKSVL